MTERSFLPDVGRKEAIPIEISPIELLAGAAASRTSVDCPKLNTRNRLITRNRPIQSCSECRARKHKCDRRRPICKHCIDSKREHKCTYRDDQKNERASQRMRFAKSDQTPSALHPIQSHCNFYDKQELGRDSILRLRLAQLRVKALEEVLENHGDLILPTLDEADRLFSIYRNTIEPFVRCAMTELNVPRYEASLKWWYQKTTVVTYGQGEVKFDPSSFPLTLVVLALSQQAYYSRESFTHPLCSSQEKLIRVAGDCVDALQASCPPSWAIAFLAPIDLIKAIALRGRWFLHRLQFQMAGSCFATALHIACSSGLHRDGSHWPSMQHAEAEARRQLWWYILSECLNSDRLDRTSTILPSLKDFDTRLPTSKESIEQQQENILREYSDSELLKRRLPLLCDNVEFEFHTLKHRWGFLRLKKLMQLRERKGALSNEKIQELSDLYQETILGSTAPLQWTDADEDKILNLGVFEQECDSLEQRHLYEKMILYIEYHTLQLELSMPQLKCSEELEPSLSLSLSSAQSLVPIVCGALSSSPPIVLIEPLLHAALLSGMVLAFVANDSHRSTKATSMLIMPLLQRLLRSLSLCQTNFRGKLWTSVEEYTGKIQKFISELSNNLGNMQHRSHQNTVAFTSEDVASWPFCQGLEMDTLSYQFPIESDLTLGTTNNSYHDPFVADTIDINKLWIAWQSFYEL